MKVPQGETPITIVEWNAKSDPIPQVVSRVLEEVSSQQLSSVATWTKDKEDGDLTKQTLTTLAIKGAKIVDLKEFADQMNQIKTVTELKNLKVAAAFIQWTFQKVVTEVEDIIDSDKPVKHS